MFSWTLLQMEKCRAGRRKGCLRAAAQLQEAEHIGAGRMAGRASETSPFYGEFFSADDDGDAWGRPPLVVQDKGQQHVDLVLYDLARFQSDLLLLDPRAANIPNGLVRAGEARLDRVFKTLRRRRADLRHFRYRHGWLLPLPSDASHVTLLRHHVRCAHRRASPAVPPRTTIVRTSLSDSAVVNDCHSGRSDARGPGLGARLDDDGELTSVQIGTAARGRQLHPEREASIV